MSDNKDNLMTIDEMVAQRKKLTDEIHKIDHELREATNLPHGWHIDPGHGLRSGGITLHGSIYNYDDGREENVSICVHSDGLFIQDHEREQRSPSVDTKAISAAIRIFEMKTKDKFKKAK